MFIKEGDVIELKDKESRYGKLVVRSVINPDTQFTTLACEDEHGDWLWLNLDEVIKCPIGVKLIGSDCPKRFTLDKVYTLEEYSLNIGDGTVISDDGYNILFILVGKERNCAHLVGYDCYWEWVYSGENVVVNSEDVKIDNINPNHYKHNGIETIEYMKAISTKEEYEGHLRLTAIKYLSRFGKKGEKLEQAEKAAWYVNKLIDSLKGE